jgi:hypothetical protein
MTPRPAPIHYRFDSMPVSEANSAGMGARHAFRPVGHHLQVSDSLCHDRGGKFTVAPAASDPAPAKISRRLILLPSCKVTLTCSSRSAKIPLIGASLRVY